MKLMKALSDHLRANILKYGIDKHIYTQLVGDKSRTLAAFKTLFPGIHPEKVARAAGAVDGSHVQFSSGHPNTVRVTINHYHDDDVNKEEPLFHAVRSFHKVKDENGNPTLVIEHHTQTATGEHLGQGHHRFNEQLGHLRDLGVRRIHVESGVGTKGSDYNGYRVWPSYGYNGNLGEEHLNALSHHIRAALDNTPKDFHSLFSIPGGKEDWADKGFDTDSLVFDTHPDSEHSKRFQEYYKQRLLKGK